MVTEGRKNRHNNSCGIAAAARPARRALAQVELWKHKLATLIRETNHNHMPFKLCTLYHWRKICLNDASRRNPTSIVWQGLFWIQVIQDYHVLKVNLGTSEQTEVGTEFPCPESMIVWRNWSMRLCNIIETTEICFQSWHLCEMNGRIL